MARTPLSSIAQFAPCVIYIRGKVAFSRITSRIDEAELSEQQNKERARAGRIIHTKPYMFITINNPTILDNGKLPPQVKSVIQERFFVRQDGTTGYTQESKSPYFPVVLYSGEVPDLKGQGIADGNTPLQAELAQGLDVTLGVDLFSMKDFGTVGLGIKYILLNEPVKYFSRMSMDEELEALGISNYTPVSSSGGGSSSAPQDIAPQMSTPVAAVPFNPTPAPQPQVVAPAPQPTPVSQPVTPSAQVPYQYSTGMPAQPYAPAGTYNPPGYAAPGASNIDLEEGLPFDIGPTPQSLNVGSQQVQQRPIRYY